MLHSYARASQTHFDDLRRTAARRSLRTALARTLAPRTHGTRTQEARR